MQSASFFSVVSDRPVPLHHLLVALLTFTRVMKVFASMDAVVDVAVHSPSLLVHKEEDVVALGRWANPALLAAAVPFVELSPFDRSARSNRDCHSGDTTLASSGFVLTRTL